MHATKPRIAQCGAFDGIHVVQVGYARQSDGLARARERAVVALERVNVVAHLDAWMQARFAADAYMFFQHAWLEKRPLLQFDDNRGRPTGRMAGEQHVAALATERHEELDKDLRRRKFRAPEHVGERGQGAEPSGALAIASGT